MTNIEWTKIYNKDGSIKSTGETWNPVTGCTKISDGCKNCYAATMHKRLRGMGQKKYLEPFNVVREHADELDRPDTWHKQKMIL